MEFGTREKDQVRPVCPNAKMSETYQNMVEAGCKSMWNTSMEHMYVSVRRLVGAQNSLGGTGRWTL